MSDDPKRERWQPPAWLRAEPAEWRSTKWDEWVARDSPFAPKESAVEPPPAVEPVSPEPAESPGAPEEPAAPTFREQPTLEPEPTEESGIPQEEPSAARAAVSENLLRARAWESLGLRPFEWLTDDQVARLVIQNGEGEVVAGPTVRALGRELLGESFDDDPASGGDREPFALPQRSLPEPMSWVGRGLLALLTLMILGPLGAGAMIVGLFLLAAYFSTRQNRGRAQRDILRSYRAAIERERRRTPE